MNFLLAITWDVSPEIFSIGPLTIRWYGPLFAGGFLIGYFIVRKIFFQEGASEEWLDKLLVYLIVGTVVGARLGHVFFYGWDYYQDHLIEIPMIWKGGLASHGGLIGLMVTFWLYARNVSKRSVFWAMDRVAPQVALAGVMIRLGNLFNSEILGNFTGSDYGFRFLLVDGPNALPRHPAQLYESMAYLLVFGIMSYLFWKTNLRWRKGFLSGMLILLIFLARLILEQFKIEQAETSSEFVASMLEIMTMGQWLSIPAILLGLSFIAYSFTTQPDPVPEGFPLDPPKRPEPAKKKKKTRK